MPTLEMARLRLGQVHSLAKASKLEGRSCWVGLSSWFSVSIRTHAIANQPSATYKNGSRLWALRRGQFLSIYSLQKPQRSLPEADLCILADCLSRWEHPGVRPRGLHLETAPLCHSDTICPQSPKNQLPPDSFGTQIPN